MSSERMLVVQSVGRADPDKSQPMDNFLSKLAQRRESRSDG